MGDGKHSRDAHRILMVSKPWVTVTAPQAATPPAMNALCSLNQPNVFFHIPGLSECVAHTPVLSTWLPFPLPKAGIVVSWSIGVRLRANSCLWTFEVARRVDYIAKGSNLTGLLGIINSWW